MYIKLGKIKEQKDGSALIDVEYDNQLRDIVKSYYKKPRCTNKLIEKFILEGLNQYIKTQEKLNDK